MIIPKYGPISLGLHFKGLTLVLVAPILILLSIGCSSSSFTLLSGEKKSLSDYEGSWLVVNYWALWCKPCIKEMPELNQLAIDNGDSIKVLGVSFDPLSEEKLLNVAKDFDIQYDMALNSPEPQLPFEIPTMLPANYFVEPNGKWHGPVYGVQSAQSVLGIISKIEKGEYND